MKVKADIRKNRLYFTITGQAKKESLDKLYTDVRFSVADLQPGFDVISDLSECHLGHLSCVPTLRKIMNFLITKEVGEVVRIIKPKSIIVKQFINLSSIICGYKPSYVYSLEEAEEKLASFKKRNGIRFHVNYLPVEYVANDMKGKGSLRDISISGCAMESATLPVSSRDEISISIVFTKKDLATEEFTIQASVIRTEDDNKFAAQFKDLDEERKDRLLKCLIYESQREIESFLNT
jgi:hypothetical protein